jgi:hypothetical protein
MSLAPTSKASLSSTLPSCYHLYVMFLTAAVLPPVMIVKLNPSLFELDRQARPARQTGIRLYVYRPLPAEGQNKSWGLRLTAKALAYQGRHLNKI